MLVEWEAAELHALADHRHVAPGKKYSSLISSWNQTGSLLPSSMVQPQLEELIKKAELSTLYLTVRFQFPDKH